MPDKNKDNISDILAEIDRWGRRLKLNVHFNGNSNDNSTDKWNKKKSRKWTPSSSKLLDEYIENVRNDIMSNITNKYNRNISRKENEALKQLLDDDSIIIRPSDKGSQIVIYDTEYYSKLVEHNLENSKLYKKVDENPTDKNNKKLLKLLKTMKELDTITPELEKNLIYKDGHAGKVQGNPKTHKEGNEIRLIINFKKTFYYKHGEIC